MRCDTCGLEAQTRTVQLQQNIGMLVARRSQSVKGNLCKPCINSYFWRYMLVNCVLGWWGIISAIMTPLFIANNLFQFIASRGLGAASIGANPLPTYVANPSSAHVQCPHCQSYQTNATKLNGAVLVSIVGSALLLLWGALLELAYLQGRSSFGNMVIGIIVIAVGAFAVLSVWMLLGNRMWECQQCRRIWVPRRN